MEPLLFEPYLRPQVWGGRRLQTLLGKPLPAEGTFGESWEVSAHPHHVSRVAEGPLRGALLSELCAERGRDLFGAASPAGRFPLLVKLLDCNDLLSIQVHPTDELAARLLPGEMGKTEAWVVLAAEPTARIYAGLQPGVSRADLERHLTEGTTDRCLHSFSPQPGDCVFLPAGTVHAVGGGVLMAEVQQTSDATFRLFDWNRPGSDGKPRALHLRESLESINWSAGPVRPVEPVALPELPAGGHGERLVRCRYFELDRFTLDGAWALPSAGRLSLWLVLDGQAELRSAAGYRRALRGGETVLVPASAEALSWVPSGEGPATLLAARLPRR
jgi:mannose-6-phosphate isomerase